MTAVYAAAAVVVTAVGKAHHLVRFEGELGALTAVYLVIALLTSGGQ